MNAQIFHFCALANMTTNQGVDLIIQTYPATAFRTNNFKLIWPKDLAK